MIFSRFCVRYLFGALGQANHLPVQRAIVTDYTVYLSQLKLELYGLWSEVRGRMYQTQILVSHASLGRHCEV
jgi:hypothetical protein